MKNEEQLLKLVCINIKRLRKSQNLSQEELAFRCNISKNYLSDVERYQRNFTLNVLQKIVEGLNVEINELFRVN